jgi:Protein of unknown function (DUF935)
MLSFMPGARAAVTREIATIARGRDITRPWLGALLDPQDSVLRLNQFDYEVYEALLRDDQVGATLQQRRSAVISREWAVTPGGDKRLDKQAADFIRGTLTAIGWDNVCDKMLFGRHYGFAVAECLFAPEGGRVVLKALPVRKQRRFRFDQEKQLRLLTWENMLEGEVLPPQKFWVVACGGDNDDDPYGLGLGYWLYWLVYFKKQGFKYWGKFLERFAVPTAKGTYQGGATKEEIAKLRDALHAFGEDAAIMVPEGVLVELIEASRSGTADYQGFIKHLNGAIAKVVLSQTMTTDDGSSLSQAQVHSGVKLEVVKSDSDLLDSSANDSWVRWLTDWNFPGAAYPVISRDLEQSENLNDRAGRDKTLSEMGFRLTPAKVLEVYGDGYYDPAQLAKDNAEKPPLVSVLGVGGTQSLVDFLQRMTQIGLKRQNAIAALITVFGMSMSDAEAMVPDDEAEPPDDTDYDKLLEDKATNFSEEARSPFAFAVLQSLDSAVEQRSLDFGEKRG